MKPRPAGTDGDVRDARAGVLFRRLIAVRLSNRRVPDSARHRQCGTHGWYAQRFHSGQAALKQSGNSGSDIARHRQACRAARFRPPGGRTLAKASSCTHAPPLGHGDQRGGLCCGPLGVRDLCVIARRKPKRLAPTVAAASRRRSFRSSSSLAMMATAAIPAIAFARSSLSALADVTVEPANAMLRISVVKSFIFTPPCSADAPWLA